MGALEFMVEINDLVGKPYSETGYGPHSYSCYGLLWEVYRRFGIDLPKVNISVLACVRASNEAIARGIENHWQSIPKPEVPCAVEIRSINPKYPNHVAIYVGGGRIIHAQKHQVTVDRLSKWKHKVMGFYRYDHHS